MSGPAVDFDANATSPVHPEAWRAYLDATHAPPTKDGAEAALAAARASVAAALGARADEVFFTSGGTAANGLALSAAVAAAAAAAAAATFDPAVTAAAAGAAPGVAGADIWAPHGAPVTVVVSALEHAAVRDAARAAAARGVMRVYPWPATPDGTVDLGAAEATLACRPQLVSVLRAHNETGALQPLNEVVRAARAVGAAVHTDAVQAVGRVPVNFAELGVHMLSLSGHKFGAVGGVGALLVRRGTAVHAAMRARSSSPPAVRCHAAWALERGPAAEARNLPGVASLAAALAQHVDSAALARLATLRDHLEATLCAALGTDACRVLAAAAPRLPHVSCLQLVGAPAEAVLMALDMSGFAVSAGAACATGALEPSPSLRAMGLDKVAAREVVRVSLPHTATPAEVTALGVALADCARRARSVDG